MIPFVLQIYHLFLESTLDTASATFCAVLNNSQTKHVVTNLCKHGPVTVTRLLPL